MRSIGHASVRASRPDGVRRSTGYEKTVRPWCCCTHWDTNSTWDRILDASVGRFAIIVVYLRGHGASSWPGSYSFQLMRDDVIGVLDELGLESVLLLGHSMGGVVA